MKWKITLHPAFEKELQECSREVRNGILAKARSLADFGPDLGRRLVDTIKNSRFPNMKELRCDLESGTWRIAFAFDPRRHAVFLVAGDKSGVSERRFYKRLTAKADKRFEQHLAIQNRRQ